MRKEELMRKLQKIFFKVGRLEFLASLALFVAVSASSRACMYIFHQPKVPDELKK